MLVQEGDQKIENFFLPLGQCHHTPLEYESIVGEVKANSQGGCKPPLWCLTKCGDWRYSFYVSCSCRTTRRRLPHVTNFTRTARSKRCRSQSCPRQDRGYAAGISERDLRKVWKADLSLCQAGIARTRSELA